MKESSQLYYENSTVPLVEREERLLRQTTPPPPLTGIRNEDVHFISYCAPSNEYKYREIYQTI